MRRVLLIAAAVLLFAPPAHAATSDQRITLAVARDYQNDGVIDPCKFTTEELQTALDTAGPDIKQYGADFPQAIRAAIDARARGDCEPQTQPTVPTATPTASPTPSPSPAATATPAETDATPVPTVTTIPEPPLPDTQLAYAPPSATTSDDVDSIGPTDNDTPVPLLLLGGLVVLCSAIGVMRYSAHRAGLSEGPLAGAHHAWREGMWRLGGSWETFREWVRLGR